MRQKDPGLRHGRTILNFDMTLVGSQPGHQHRAIIIEIEKSISIACFWMAYLDDAFVGVIRRKWTTMHWSTQLLTALYCTTLQELLDARQVYQ